MMKWHVLRLLVLSVVTLAASTELFADDIKLTDTYRRIKASLDEVRAIDTHDHLRAFDALRFRVDTPQGRGMTLYGIWTGSYFPWVNPLTPWPDDGEFETWWKHAEHDFDDARAQSSYRAVLPAFKDLYDVDFETMSPAEAKSLNDRIFDNYKDDRWFIDVITRRANIELIVNDPNWNPLDFTREYQFSARVFNVTMLMTGSHPDRFTTERNDSLYEYADRQGKPIHSFDDYLAMMDVIFQEAVEADVIGLKSTQAYQRTLQYRRTTKADAEIAFGKNPSEVTATQQRAFEDFMFWEVCRLSAKYDLPFQVHTGHARIQGSNPLLLVNVIAANPDTKFILFHGGFPWVGETGAIAMRHSNVWVDSVWLPTLSYTMAKRAYQEWLEVMPSDRIMWGADISTAETIYAATEFTRRCLAEALAEKVQRGELREDHAMRIGQQILRDNALKLFPKLRTMLWRTD